ncbi:MAG: hypothetical protein MHM6MM_003412, partial [Cercozoa sp. M6MM]
ALATSVSASVVSCGSSTVEPAASSRVSTSTVARPQRRTRRTPTTRRPRMSRPRCTAPRTPIRRLISRCCRATSPAKN